MEKVLSILILLSARSEIIETLRDDRNSWFLSTSIDSVRSASEREQYNTLIHFSREIRNMVTYIKAANLQDHL